MKKIYKYLLMTVVASSTMFYSCETLEMEDLASPNSLSADLADADLFSMSFNRESASMFSMELTCLVEEWFNREGENNSVLLVSPDGACGHSEFVAVLQDLGQRCDLDFSSSSDHSDQLHEYFLYPVVPSINPSSNLLY